MDNKLDPDSIASPCGLIAKSFFNDTFAIDGASTPVHIDETGISWPNDKGKKFKVLIPICLINNKIKKAASDTI